MDKFLTIDRNQDDLNALEDRCIGSLLMKNQLVVDIPDVCVFLLMKDEEMHRSPPIAIRMQLFLVSVKPIATMNRLE